MRMTKAHRRIARRLFRGCFVNEQFDETRARATVAALAREKPRGHLAILGVLHRLVRLEVARTSAIVESSLELGSEQRALIEQRLQQLYRRSIAASFQVNPALIGGARITVGSDVWDGSIANRLEMLKQEA